MSNKEHIRARMRQVEERYENELGCAIRNKENALMDIRSKCEHENGFVDVQEVDVNNSLNMISKCLICGLERPKLYQITYDPNASTEAPPVDWGKIQKMQDQCTHPDGFQEDRMYSGHEIIAKRWMCKTCGLVKT